MGHQEVTVALPALPFLAEGVEVSVPLPLAMALVEVVEAVVVLVLTLLLPQVEEEQSVRAMLEVVEDILAVLALPHYLAQGGVREATSANIQHQIEPIRWVHIP
jgi:hypothetical protein